MSSRIVPLAALSVVLVVIFWAVVATAQQPVAQPQYNPEQYAQPGQAQPGQAQPGQFQQVQPQVQPVGQVQPVSGPVAGPAYNGPPQEPVPQPLAQAPFTLSPQEEAMLDRILVDWQKKSGEVKTLEADFTRWDYGGVFSDATKPARQVTGKLKYAAPDKGYYALDDGSEKWICTGDAVFEFKNDLKEMREHPLPPAMRGQAISEGPMPFVFGVEAAKMKARYWMKLNTPQEQLGKQVWMEVYPRHAKDAENFQKVDIILTFAFDGTQVTKLEPYALNLHKPNGKERDVYRFETMSINNPITNLKDWFGFFVRPSAPFGWRHKVMEPQNAQPPAQQPGVAQPFGAGQPAPLGAAQPGGNPITNVQPGVDVGQAPAGALR